MPAGMPAEMPAEMLAEMPAKMPAKMPTEMPAEMPTEMPAGMPAKMPAKMPAEMPVARIHLDGGIEEITLQGRGKKLQSEASSLKDELEDLAMRRPARRLMNKDKQGKATSALRTNDTANAPAGGSAAEVGGFPWERRNVDALANAAALIDSQLRKEGAPASGEKGGNPRSQ
eukprot:gene19739-23613_t